MRITHPQLRRLVAIAGATLLTSSCSSGGGGDVPTVPASIAISTSASAATVARGTSGTVPLTLSRVNYTGDVQLVAEGAPSGVTTSFAPATLSGGVAQSTLTISADNTAAPGTSTITVRARGAGVTDVTTAVVLTVPVPPAYTMVLNPTTLPLTSGASGTVNIALTRTNFTGAVSLAATGLPAGATASFSPNPATADASVLTLSAGTAAPGTYTVTVTGSATGLADRVATLAFTITPLPGFTMSLASPTASVAAGGSTTVNVALARTSFTAPVSFAATGVPAGATVNFAPNPTTTDATVATINAGTAAPGSYAVTITASAAGVGDRTATLTLSITASAGTNVRFAFCADDLPLWVGYQDGTGAWKQATAAADHSYSFTISGRGGVAAVRQAGGVSAPQGYETDVYFASADELQTFGAGNCATPVLGTKVVNGSVGGAGTGTTANYTDIALGNATAATFGNGAFTLDSLQNGAYDLLATMMTGSSLTVQKMIIRRGLDLASGATLPVLDFGSAEAFAVTPSSLVLTGEAASTPVFTFSTFLTASGTSISTGVSQATAATATYTGVPNAIATDLEQLLVEAMETGGARGAIAYFTGTGTRTFTLGPRLSVPILTSLGTTPYARLRAQYASQAIYNAIALVSFQQTSTTAPSSNRTVTIVATPGYFGAVPTTWDISIPDFSGANGFQASWMLAGGVSTSVTAGAYGGNILTGAPAAGTTIYFAQNESTITTTAVSASRLQRLAPTPRLRTKISAPDAQVLEILRNRRNVRRL